MSEVNVTVGTLCKVNANYDGITLAITVSVCQAGSVQLQADWEQTDDTSADFIKNKPTLDDSVTETSPNAVKSSGIWAALESLWQSVMDAFELLTASSIIVSDPVTPDYTAPKVGDTMQDVTNKVAGLQLKTLVDYTLTSPQHTIEFTKDDSGKSLAIYKSIIILVDIIGYQDEIGNAQNGRMTIRFNDITTGYDWGGATNDPVIHINSGAVSFQRGMVLLQINSNGFIGFSVSNAQSYGLTNKQVVEPITKVSFSTRNPTLLASIGSRMVILGQ